MPTDLTSIATYVAAFVFVIALIGIGAWLLKGATSKGNNKTGSFLRGRERRLGVVEAANVDGRRKTGPDPARRHGAFAHDGRTR